MARENAKEQELRWKKLEYLQQEYASFVPFLEDCMGELGFSVSEIQRDIAQFLEHGPEYLMIQAQRGQAKTTITACFAVWCLIHDPKHRVLILSAGGTQANEISTLIVRLILTMEQLECLRPDATEGDRTSVEAFDVHYALKGIDKSPSVACVGITGNLQGKRADLLVADDIESVKNARTPAMREILLELTRDFTSICSSGRIIYLGTPQSQDSIYNTLPGRGFVVRIWPGRYPTQAQLENYGDMLAPYILRKLLQNPVLAYKGGMLADQGQPTDPSFMGEAILQKKELDQGPTYFQLQHMLNTKLADALRFPLKLEQLVVMQFGANQSLFPVTVTRGMTDNTIKAYSVGTQVVRMQTPYATREQPDLAPLQGTVMYVDPAGGGKNGDETGYAVVGFLNGNIYWLAGGGVPGGYSIEVLEHLADIAARWKVNTVKIEKNMGYGAFREVWLPILRKKHPIANVEDDMVHGQKELRIIETLEPVIARGSLIVNEALLDEDRDCCERHQGAQRYVYSVFHQMSKITRDRNCLIHDDRLDALEGAVRHFVAQLAIDQHKAVVATRAKAHADAMKDPMGYSRYDPPGRMGTSLLNKYRR
jgi:hypothetical protein